MATQLKQIIANLKAYYSVPLRYSFHKFRNGLIYFSVGLIIIYLASASMPPSLMQELVTLAGIALTTIGFVIALTAQIRMIISRLLSFFKK